MACIHCKERRASDTSFQWLCPDPSSPSPVCSLSNKQQTVIGPRFDSVCSCIVPLNNGMADRRERPSNQRVYLNRREWHINGEQLKWQGAGETDFWKRSQHAHANVESPCYSFRCQHTMPLFCRWDPIYISMPQSSSVSDSSTPSVSHSQTFHTPTYTRKITASRNIQQNVQH